MIKSATRWPKKLATEIFSNKSWRAWGDGRPAKPKAKAETEGDTHTNADRSELSSHVRPQDGLRQPGANHRAIPRRAAFLSCDDGTSDKDNDHDHGDGDGNVPYKYKARA